MDGVTAAQRARGRHLALIHDMYLQELAHVRRTMELVEAEQRPPQALADAVDAMPMLDGVRRFGTLCGRQCHMLLIHHAIEEQSIFPALDRADSGLGPVIARLRAEHAVIHALLERLAEAASIAARAPGPDGLAAVKAAFEALDPAIRSHFRYEQTELEEALGYWGVLV
jgi:hypothetical protein